VDKGFSADEDVEVVIRPEDIRVVPPEDAPLVGMVESVIFKGVHYEMTVGAHGYNWLIHSTRSEEEGTKIGMNILPDDIHIMRAPKEVQA
jgi:spermidine/putrescine transport system ATP-binding protein